MMRLVLSLALVAGLAGCAADDVWAPDDVVSRAVYSDPGPAKLTLFTMVNNANNRGLHTGLMISGSQRVIFDPAGSFSLDRVPERHDVHYGITPALVEVYVDYHARETYRVRIQEIEVSREVADMALRLAQERGPVYEGYCTRAVAQVLRQLPGFQDIDVTWFPGNLSEQFGNRPGVSVREIIDNDPDDNDNVLLQYEANERLYQLSTKSVR